MATWDDVRRLALGMPEATEVDSRGRAQWRVKDKLFVWERPLRRSDLAALGDAAPDGPILAVRVEDLGEKEAVLAAHPNAFFTIPHFDGYAAVLIQLKKATKRPVREALTDGWLACAPPRLVEQFLET